MFPPPVEGQLNKKLSTATRTGPAGPTLPSASLPLAAPLSRTADTPVSAPSGGGNTPAGPPSSPEFAAGTAQLNSASTNPRLSRAGRHSLLPSIAARQPWHASSNFPSSAASTAKSFRIKMRSRESPLVSRARASHKPPAPYRIAHPEQAHRPPSNSREARPHQSHPYGDETPALSLRVFPSLLRVLSTPRHRRGAFA